MIKILFFALILQTSALAEGQIDGQGLAQIACDTKCREDFFEALKKAGPALSETQKIFTGAAEGDPMATESAPVTEPAAKAESFDRAKCMDQCYAKNFPDLHAAQQKATTNQGNGLDLQELAAIMEALKQNGGGEGLEALPGLLQQ